MTILFTSAAFAQQPQEQPKKDDFKYLVEQFADLKIMRYQVPGFENLGLRQKELVYYLSQAALCGRDIIFDQNYKNNLLVRRTLEAIVDSYKGQRKSKGFEDFMVYTKRVWFSNGIHHHYSSDKIMPAFTQDYFSFLVRSSAKDKLPMTPGQDIHQFIDEVSSIIFDKEPRYKQGFGVEFRR
jgi:dipeptidyl-peptidase-3